MTVHLLRGAGSWSGNEWRQRNRQTVPLVNRPDKLSTACGLTRPAFDVVDAEAKVTCGSCKRSSEFGTNYRDAVARDRARARQAAIRTAARNIALRQLVEAHPDEYARRYHDERTLLALSLTANQFPPDEGLPQAPRTGPPQP